MKKYLMSFMVASAVVFYLYLMPSPITDVKSVEAGPTKACVTTFVDWSIYGELFGNSNSVVVEVEAKCGGGANASACEPIHFSITMDYIGGNNQVFDHQFDSGVWTPGLCDGVTTSATCRCIPLFPGNVYNYTIIIDNHAPIVGQFVP